MRSGANEVQVKKWRRGRDLNPRYRLDQYDGLANRCFRPLSHLSAVAVIIWIIARDQRRSPGKLTGISGRDSLMRRVRTSPAYCAG